MGRFVGVKQIGSRSAWAILAVMAIVALLGYQQYRWILMVADAEERTNRERLEPSVKAFGDDFDTEITRADLAFAALTGNSSSDLLENVRERLKTFRDVTEYPGLIASVDITEGLPNPFEVAAGPPPVLIVPAGLTQANFHPLPGQFLAVQPLGGGGTNLHIETGTGMQRGSSRPSVRVILDQPYIGSYWTSLILPAR